MIGSVISKVGRKRRIQDEDELEMNSLMDILVVILIFLILNSDQSQQKLILPPDIILPQSVSQDITKRGIMIGVDSSLNLIIENKVFKNLKKVNFSSIDQQLIKKMITTNRQYLDKQSKLSGAPNDTVNFVMHSNLTFQYVDYIMKHMEGANLTNLKMIVIGQ